MDDMLGENKNLKDPISPSTNIALRDSVTVSITYTKTNKLVTALFMVTDIMDKDEPLRNKLRILGVEIISDMHTNPINSDKKIAEILAFLDICSEIRMISEMNSTILKKEFSELHQSVKEFSSKKSPIWLEEFMKDDDKPAEVSLSYTKTKPLISNHIGHLQSTRIGVQKGSTLLKALRGVQISDKSSFQVSHQSKNSQPAEHSIHAGSLSYEVLKNKRREEIVGIIKNKLSVLPESSGATITDIKNSAEGPLVSCGEKTLQRELVSMVHDGVLYKTGEKRWSKYSLKKA